MNDSPSVIRGSSFSDHRGSVTFVNDFQMDSVKRMYYIEPLDCGIIRAWQGHRREQKWFYCMKGSLQINVISIDDWSAPSRDLEILEFEISKGSNEVIHIPGGYVNGFKALEDNTTVLVFSDFSVGDSIKDDYRFELDYWDCKWK